MKFYDKYHILKQKAFLAQMLSNSVLTTMSLENQQVELSKVNEIMQGLLKEKESEGNQFFSD